MQGCDYFSCKLPWKYCILKAEYELLKGKHQLFFRQTFGVEIIKVVYWVYLGLPDVWQKGGCVLFGLMFFSPADIALK